MSFLLTGEIEEPADRTRYFTRLFLKLVANKRTYNLHGSTRSNYKVNTITVLSRRTDAPDAIEVIMHFRVSVLFLHSLPFGFKNFRLLMVAIRWQESQKESCNYENEQST